MEPNTSVRNRLGSIGKSFPNFIAELERKETRVPVKGKAAGLVVAAIFKVDK